MTESSAHETWLERARRERLVVLLDLDGTLIPFADSVEEAALDRAGANLLEALGYSGIQVVIVSGRHRGDVERVRSAATAAWWFAEHGAWRRAAGEWHGPEELGELESLVAALASLASVPGIVLERKSLGICVHWRLVEPSNRADVIASIGGMLDAWIATHPNFARLDGVEIAEVRHRSITKARAVAWVREQMPEAHLIAIGDDETDEDMFGALLHDEVGLAVRNSRERSTRAHATLSSPTAVREFLWWIIETRTRGANRPPPIDPLR